MGTIIVVMHDPQTTNLTWLCAQAPGPMLKPASWRMMPLPGLRAHYLDAHAVLVALVLLRSSRASQCISAEQLILNFTIR